VAAVLPGDRLPPWRTALGAVCGPVRRQGVPFWEAWRRAQQALGWAQASAVSGRTIATLDVPARQRVLLAQALAVVPGLLVLDWPAAVLSTANRQAANETLRTLSDQWEMVVLVSAATGLSAHTTLLPTMVSGGTVGGTSP
jgi:ABC-type taurine transport system ATPase subunit